MYFVTNNEDYIIAASKSFLDKIGQDDVCSISLALKNRDITILEDDELRVVDCDIEFKYSIIELHSVFGKLDMYKISLKDDIANIENENIEYLKKIKEGLIQTDDNEFSIPSIKKEDISTKEQKEQDNKEYENLDVIKIFDNSDEIAKDDKSESIKIRDYTISDIDENSNKTVIEESTIEDNKATTQSSGEELLKLINQEIEDSEDKDNKEDLSKIIETEEITKQEDEVEEKIIEIDSKDDNKDINQKESKKEGISKLTSKFFPWGSKDVDEDIELEDTNITTANELLDESLSYDSEITNVIKKDEEIIIEEVEDYETTKQESDIAKDVIETKEIDLEEQESKEDKVDDKLEVTTLYKLIELKVDAINFNKNANMLSIDVENYKLLLDNYLDEIENYRSDLEDNKRTTVEMLIDASNLLSLDIITDYLQKLPSQSALKELFITIKLIREKLDNNFNKIENELYEESKDDEEIDLTPPSIPQDMIDITSAENLLKSIKSKKVEFNPQKASDELNLPESLIIEFVNDFAKQAKEHLPQLVQGYKNDDIKTLQTTAHMLKGAASNLRLDEIAETLFKIQKENVLSNSGELIKEFVAQLKGLEDELKEMEMIDNED